MNIGIFIYMNPHKPHRKKKEPTMKTSLELPEKLWREAKIRALDDHSNFKNVVVAALEAYLGKGKPRRGGKA